MSTSLVKPLVDVTFHVSGSRDEPRRIHVRIDRPRRAHTGEWACSVSATGLVKRTPVRGGDSLQALCLAMEFLGNALYEARRRGIRLRYDTGHEVPLFAYFRLREYKRRLTAIARRHLPARVRTDKRPRRTRA